MQHATVHTLYRHPMKGFTPEAREALRIAPPGYIEGDRVLGLLLGDAGDPEAEVNGDGWWRKPSFVTLMTTPGLARLTLRFDDASFRLAITHDSGEVLVDSTIDDHGRAEIASAIERYVRTLDEAPDLDRPGRTPLRLIGDGTPRYQDSGSGRVTLHSTASLQAVASGAGVGSVDGRRFRSNIVIDGVDPWEELAWGDRTLRIGEMAFDVVKPVVRCLATHANPERGERDIEMLRLLPTLNGIEDPSFAMALTPREPGEIRVGDPVVVE